MKKLLLAFVGLAFLCMMAASADACYINGSAKWAMHYAGMHDAKMNTCDYAVVDCLTDVVETGMMGPGRFDVYVLALDTDGIAGTRYGIFCEPDFQFYFYGWTKCSDFEIPTAGWPGHLEGNAQTWVVQQPPGHVTLGILDVYVYPGMAHLKTGDDPRKGFAEWCDGTSPEPICCQRDYEVYPQVFGYVGFGCPGYNPCGVISTEKSSWGAVKAIYR
jgi:hypothetical protein